MRAAGRLAIAGMGVAIFAVHASAYRGWLIDDSGISFAYAINLANGQGLVSQPGVLPVEGYSNPLWVFLLAVLCRAGLFALPLAPKILAGVFIAAMYVVLLAIIERIAIRTALVGASVVVACALNPSVVIWSVSGLENALYSFGIVALAYCTIRALELRGSRRAAVACAVVASVVAMTRPDGVLFAFIPPAVLFAAGERDTRRLRVYAAAFGGLFGAFLVGRFATFHSLVPNTAVAKGTPGVGNVLDFVLLTRHGIDKMDRVLDAVFFESLSNIVWIAMVLAVWFARKKGRFAAALGSLLTYATAALADYMLMPADWMRENRFATAFFPLYYAAVFLLLDLAIEMASIRGKSISFAAVAASLLFASVPGFAGRALVFMRSTNIDLSFVRRAFAERFDRYAGALHLDAPSVLLPDVGGMLLWSHLRVHDLAGLCDASIARTGSRDPDAEREYILARLRPTFIHTYGKWSKIARLERDPRFATDYAIIHEYSSDEDSESDGHASGIFVRRDALTSGDAEATLASLRREPHKRQAFLPDVPPSLVRRWLEAAPFVPNEYRVGSVP